MATRYIACDFINEITGKNNLTIYMSHCLKYESREWLSSKSAWSMQQDPVPKSKTNFGGRDKFKAIPSYMTNSKQA